MTDPRDFGPEDELSAGERRAFDALPRELVPAAELEDRTVALLRRTGHLPTPITVASGQGARSPRWWMAGAAAAAVAIFATGMAGGMYIGMHNAAIVANASARNAAEAADRVQRTGDRYVAALASLGRLADTSDVQGRARAREAALAVLGAAAEEIAHLAPDDPLAAAVMRGLNQRSREQRPEAPSRSVIWY